MTPSEAHETALNRESGHDQMQEAFFAWLQDHLTSTTGDCPSGDRKHVEWPRVQLTAEELYSGRFGIAFADIAAVFRQPDGGGKHPHSQEHYTIKGRREMHIIFELKPRILSPAAVLRQCRMLAHRLSASDTFRSSEGVQAFFRIIVVAAAGDPAIDRFRSLAHGEFGLLLWTGETLVDG